MSFSQPLPAAVDRRASLCDWRRASLWSSLDRSWDLIIIGGGITGAGILREASRAGLRALLLERGDFASGTSSRSSKLVHGGFRYLRNAQIKLTLESVRERDLLLRQGRGLINPLGFLLVNFAGDRYPGWVYGVGLAIYDLLAARWGHQHHSPQELLGYCSFLRTTDLIGGYRYIDASTDDARLVLRLIFESRRDGVEALNYAPVTRLLRTHSGQVRGVVVRDGVGGNELELLSSAVINATGVWADQLRGQLDRPALIRSLRGSHLFFPSARLPLNRSVSFMHPVDQRPVFAFPWEGVTLLGTTDVDDPQGVLADPCIADDEFDYLLQAARFAFPSLELLAEDVRSTLSGLRSVIGTGKSDPSKESREHLLLEEDGLLTITGGKLTTFRLMALSALRRVADRLPSRPRFQARHPVLDPISIPEGAALPQRLRLIGRLGDAAREMLDTAEESELTPIDDGVGLWTELRWAARMEQVVHLEDLLLRRLRLGLTCEQGARRLLPQIRSIVQPELGWDDLRWEQEALDYQRRWVREHAPPDQRRLQ